MSPGAGGDSPTRDRLAGRWKGAWAALLAPSGRTQETADAAFQPKI